MTFLVLLNSLLLAAREVAVRAGIYWLSASWLRALILVPMFAAQTVVNCFQIIEGKRENVIIPAVGLLTTAVLGYWIYRNVLPNLFSLAVIAISLNTVLVVLIGHMVFTDISDAFGAFVLMGLITLALFGAAICWLRREWCLQAGRVEEPQ